MDISKILSKPEYEFLKVNEHLGKYVILIGLAGSISYGTNNESSDIDIRGVTLNQKSDLLGLTSYEQYVDNDTDTTIYTFNKFIKLLLMCNPNALEMLGLRQEHYLYLDDIGKTLIEKKGLFLSKIAIRSFGGYANAQLRRLQNALARDSYSQREKENHICNSIKNGMYDFTSRYENFEEGSLKIYLDQAANSDFESEIFLDANLKHYPLRDYKNIWSEMNNIVKDYDKIRNRNKKKDDPHLNKHAMHLVRLLMTAIDILEKCEINTYRESEQELLMNIRNGKFQDGHGGFSKDFFEIVSDYEDRLKNAARCTKLPDKPDMDKVSEYVISVNESLVKEGR